MVTSDQPAFAEWAVLELMGHRRLAGYVSETQIAGHGFVRLDVPGPGDPVDAGDEDLGVAIQMAGGVTQFYAPAAVYAITPCTEEAARQVAAMGRPAPVQQWELPVRESVYDGDYDAGSEH